MNMGGIHGSSSFSLSSLLCHESEACLKDEEGEEGGEKEENDDDDKVFHANCVSEDDDEYVRVLILSESRSRSKIDDTASCGVDCSIDDVRWFKSARLRAVEWILNKRAVFGFQYHTAYLSISYFDRFISKRPIDEEKPWAIRLLSVACLSLAAKMEERSVPRLYEFSTQDYVFEDKVIMRMELLVLSTLDWRMGSASPFAYLNHFTSKIFGESVPKALVSRAVGFLMAIAKEISVMNLRPSVIAASAVLAAFDSKLTRNELEIKLGLISSWVSLETENVYSCYSLMQEIEKEKHKTPKSVVSETLSLTLSTPSDAVESTSLGLGGGTKRSLSFNGSDQIRPVKKICRS